MVVSVIIPVYNAMPYLKACLDSVFVAALELEKSSDVGAWSVEVVCVDDGSTDESGKFLDEYLQVSNSTSSFDFKVIHQPNAGEGAARNAGMAVATGELIAFLDADDAFHPMALCLFARARRSMGADVIRYGWVAVSNHNGEPERISEPVRMEIVDVRQRSESTLRFCQLGSATVISQDIARAVKWTTLRQGADMVFLLECMRRADCIVRIAAPLLHYLTHPESVSRKISVSLVAGTCRYLVPVFAGCAALGESQSAHLDTCRFVANFILSRLYGSWHEFSSSQDQAEVRDAYWESLGGLAVRNDLFRPWVRMLLAWCVRRRKELSLALLVRLPYSMMRNATSLWFAKW